MDLWFQSIMHAGAAMIRRDARRPSVRRRRPVDRLFLIIDVHFLASESGRGKWQRYSISSLKATRLPLVNPMKLINHASRPASQPDAWWSRRRQTSQQDSSPEDKQKKIFGY
ncbi:unnamed protein product [Soboliphyme baturini]|uniref:Uncharacterized protein n=1 Tax=Soboliphyme baturini TaxID=241478 RepID=A0A183IBN8_9BILA|nr:unnamed protein product [Soboliphyme baturini]